MTWAELEDEWKSEAEDIICHTSGSTGKPSVISLPKPQMVTSALRTIDFFSISRSSHLHSCISPDYIGGKMMYVRAIVSGASFSHEKPSNTPFVGYDGPDITVVSVVPSQLAYMLNHPERLPRIDSVLVGGAPMPEAMRKRIPDLPFAVYESYGMTETASHIALRRVIYPQPPFYPLNGITTSLDSRNCLQIDISGWKKVATNDIVSINPDGSFEILGRADNVIISGGVKIHPELIEQKLSAVLSFPVMAISEPHHIWGDALVLLAETAPSAEPMIMDICHRLLPHYHIPKKIIFGEIPRTANGKFMRRRKTED